MDISGWFYQAPKGLVSRTKHLLHGLCVGKYALCIPVFLFKDKKKKKVEKKNSVLNLTLTQGIGNITLNSQRKMYLCNWVLKETERRSLSHLLNINRMQRDPVLGNIERGLKIFLYKILFKSNVQQTIKNNVAPEEPTHREPEPAETTENRNRPARVSILRFQSIIQWDLECSWWNKLSLTMLAVN